jgi:hypothetical protein
MMPRRDDEIRLYALLRTVSHLSSSGNRLLQRAELQSAATSLKIPTGRAGYVLDKWEKKGWWHTSSAAGGWFTPASPAGLLPFSEIKE